MLSLSEIKDGLLAYTLTVRELETDYLPLQSEILIKSLRLINKVMSPKMIKMWMHKCWMYLESAKIEVDSIKKDFSHLYLLPHEYLSLLCNA